MPRPSPVSDEVRKLFEAGDRHAWSIAELLGSVRRVVAGANYSSVFRAAMALEEAGLVQRLELGDGVSRYERSSDHHEHVRCEICGRIADVRDCVMESVPARIKSETGFTVTSHQVVFVGRCSDCADHAARDSHTRHLNHPHQHGEGCGHLAVQHGDHMDYIHSGHRHAEHGDHWDEH